MTTRFALLLVLAAVNLEAEILKVLECHDRVVQHGIESMMLAQEVDSMFGNSNVDHYISSFGSKEHTPVWNSETYFGGRYILTLQVPISIDYETCRLNGAVGNATVYLNEVTKVEISSSGIAGATLKGGIGPRRGELSEDEWKQVVKGRGDWSILNVPITTNHPPIKHFDDFVRQAREPIRNRKEGFDNPVRQAIESLRNRKASGPDANKDKQVQGALSNDLECHERIVRHGMDTLILPGEVNSLFGATNVDHFISRFGSKTQIPVWHSVAYFAGSKGNGVASK